VAVTSDPGWTVTSDQSWLTVTKTGETGFTATAQTNGGEERKAILTISNSEGSASVFVTQASSSGIPFYVGIGNVVRNYEENTVQMELMLWSNEVMSDVKRKGGYIMTLEVVTPLFEWDGDYLDIAPGTYNPSIEAKPYTLLMDPVAPTGISHYSNGFILGLYITGGKVVIEGDHNSYDISVDFTISDGRSFKGSFSGPILVPRNGWEPPVNNDPVDVGTITDATMELVYYGDRRPTYPSDGWKVNIYSPTVVKNGDSFTGDGYLLSSEMYCQSGNEGTYLPDATYGILINAGTPPSARVGYIDIVTGFNGTWMHKIENGEIVQSWSAQTGTIITTHTGDNYTFTINGFDDTGASMKGTFTGNATITPYIR
jgi:hypothetical protein